MLCSQNVSVNVSHKKQTIISTILKKFNNVQDKNTVSIIKYGWQYYWMCQLEKGTHPMADMWTSSLLQQTD